MSSNLRRLTKRPPPELLAALSLLLGDIKLTPGTSRAAFLDELARTLPQAPSANPLTKQGCSENTLTEESCP